jgi:hypothetical protein
MDYNSVGQPVIRTVGGDIYNSINLPAGFGQVHKFGAVPAMSIDTIGTILSTLGRRLMATVR